MSNSIEIDDRAKALLAKDTFSNWLGIKILELRPGYAKTEMLVRGDMLNPHGICHGGIPFALADSTMAYAVHTHEGLAVSIEANVTYCNKVSPNQVITAETREIKFGSALATYEIVITNEKKEIVAVFRGTMFRKA